MTDVEIYTKSTCGYCYRAMQLLSAKGVAFKQVSLDFGGADRQRMIERSGGRTTVPQIFIGGRHIGGCDDLLALERQGRLDQLIGA